MSRPADLELVDKVLRETGVDQQVQIQGWSGYPRALVEGAFDAISRLRAPRGLETLPTILGPAAAVLAGVILLVSLFAFARFLFRRARDRRRPPATGGAGALVARAVPARDPAGWRAEIDRRLSKGDLPGALEALWWWFAASVSSSDVDPSWTSRELLAESGRLDLAPLGHALDRLLYGPHRPDADTVRGFLARGEEALS